MMILMTRLEGNMKMSILSFEDNCINIIKTKWTSFTPNLDIGINNCIQAIGANQGKNIIPFLIW